MTTRTGGCRCGAIRYRTDGEPQHVTLCHCRDCRHSAGSPVVAWAGFVEAQFTVTQGEPNQYRSSELVARAFCGVCGTGLLYRNPTILPDMVDVQVATFDDPETLPPSAHIQTAERLEWMATAHTLPDFARFPEQ